MSEVDAKMVTNWAGTRRITTTAKTSHHEEHEEHEETTKSKIYPFLFFMSFMLFRVKNPFVVLGDKKSFWFWLCRVRLLPV